MVERLAAGALIAATIALIARLTRSLTWSGVLAAVLVGALSFAFGGYIIAVAIIIFFVSGNALGRIRNASADRARSFAAKGAMRDASQVIANGGVATFCAIAGGVLTSAERPEGHAWIVAAVCAIAAASGDTWSTEIGAFSPSAPRRITDMRRVDAGTSGGVSLLGTVAAPLGGMLVGAAGLAQRDLIAPASWLAAGAAAGIVGSVIDSVLGATAQAQWRCTACGRVQDARVHAGCSGPGELSRGVSWLDNDGVNALATVAGAVVGYVAAGLARA